MAWDAFLKKGNVKLELLSNVDDYQFFEQAIRGGICMISKRYAKANNKYMKNYDPTKPSTFITYLDANNLYGWAMAQPLPTGGFRWLDDVETSDLDVLSIPDDNSKGYFLECDIEYPQELHDLHNDYPLCPERMTVVNEYLSQHQLDYQAKLNLKQDTVGKLVPNLMDKRNYIVHYRYLKFCINHGLKVTKIHRVIEFDQSPVMKSYIDFNTTKRASSNTDFEKDFFKLMNCAAYGKTMENLRNRFNFELVSNERKFLKLTSRPNAKRSIRFNENLVGIEMGKTSLMLNKPIYLGAAVLDLSKLLMAEFHYDFIKNNYGDKAQLLFTDTDSLCYEIETDDLWADWKPHMDLFDFSDNAKDHMLYSDANKKVIGKFKEEYKCEPIEEFVGLRPKMYSVKLNAGYEAKKAKGVKKSVIKKLIKVGLCSYDTKRHILPDNIHTYAHGHYRI